MNSIEPKKLALLRILEILNKYSDINHPLLQEKIVEILDKNYGIVLERKAVGRNLSLLKETGIDIVSSKNGSYISERLFEDSELRLLIDGVLSSRYINSNHSKELIEKLCSLSNIYFKKNVKNIYSVEEWSKTENVQLFYNIDLVDEAIERGKQLVFDYNKYGTDKKLHKSASHKVSPYQLILKNQKYYLMALNEKWGNLGYYRVDHITNMEITNDILTPIRSVKGYENGINYKDISTSLPYMFTDKLENVKFYVEEWAIDQVVDWFGKSANIEKADEKYIVSVKVSLNAMEYWAMQYINGVEVISPINLRDRIRENLKSALEKYKR